MKITANSGALPATSGQTDTEPKAAPVQNNLREIDLQRPILYLVLKVNKWSDLQMQAPFLMKSRPIEIEDCHSIGFLEVFDSFEKAQKEAGEKYKIILIQEVKPSRA